MSPHDQLDDSTRDRAALYALGSMDASEGKAYEAHLDACEICREEVRAVQRVCDSLSHLAPSEPPSPALRSRLLDRIRAGAGAASAAPTASVQIWKGWTSDAAAGLTFVPGGSAGWEPTGVAGVEVRKLFVDAANDRATMLVRMAPRTSYPSHRHAGFEECYVLEGDLLVGENRMRAGDYQRADGGSLHGVQSTENGCLLLIASSLHDELLDAHNA